VDKVFDEMEVEIDNIIEENGDEADKDHALSTDNDYVSNCSEDFTEIRQKVVTNP